MNRVKQVFITGATGLLGAYLLRDLISCLESSSINQIVALVRGDTQQEAERKIIASLKPVLPKDKLNSLPNFIKVIRGDITKEYLGMSQTDYLNFAKNITTIYHSAALCDFKIPWEIIKIANLDGTRNVLEFARLCDSKKQFKGVHFVSTVAVGGNKKGILYENQLDTGQGFHNTYEKSKFEAERLATEYRNQGIPINIYRPAIIVGDSSNGYTNNFKMVYQPLHFLSLEIFNEIPADGATEYSFCPVDCVSKAIVSLSLKDKTRNMTFNIINPHKINLDFFITTASRYFAFRKPKLIPLSKFNFGQISELEHNLIEPYIPYFNYDLWFDTKNIQLILKDDFQWPIIMINF